MTETRADFQYLFSLNRDSLVLVVGSGWGTITVSVGKRGSKVVAVDRAYSHYHDEVRLGEEKLSFEDAIEREIDGLHFDSNRLLNEPDYYSFNHQHYTYLSRGIYVDQLKRWMLYFPGKNMLIIKSEELFDSPDLPLSNIFRYLEIPDMPPQDYQRKNDAHYPDMKQTTRKRLVDYFRLLNHKLYDLLGSSFDWN